MEGIITPELVIQLYLKREGISLEELGIAPIVVASWGRGQIKSLADRAEAELCENWLHHDKHKLYKGFLYGNPVSFSHIPVGAAATVMLIEEMIASGARIIIGLGGAGSLQPQVPVGTAVIPTCCISEEGTSRHYVDPTQEITPSFPLVDIISESCEKEGLAVRKGLHWTMDAVYRETNKKINAYRKKGVLSVDMETSAMYAVGMYRGIHVCNLLPISDELWSDYYIPPSEARLSEKATQAQEQAERVILSSIKKAGKIIENH
jgi:uridine phosphorylase